MIVRLSEGKSDYRKNMESIKNQLDLTFQELKGLCTYLVTIMSLIKIKFLQKRMKHCLPAQSWLSRLLSRLGRLPMQPTPSRLGRPPSQLGRLPMLLHMSRLGRHLHQLSRLPLLLVPRSV
jgi:hypothetical protein